MCGLNSGLCNGWQRYIEPILTRQVDENLIAVVAGALELVDYFGYVLKMAGVGYELG